MGLDLKAVGASVAAYAKDQVMDAVKTHGKDLAKEVALTGGAIAASAVAAKLNSSDNVVSQVVGKSIQAVSEHHLGANHQNYGQRNASELKYQGQISAEKNQEVVDGVELLNRLEEGFSPTSNISKMKMG